MPKTSTLEPFIDSISALQKLLEHYENRWVIIGGIAVSLLGQPRFTEDLDAMIILSVEEIDEFMDFANQAGIEARISDAKAFAKKNRVLLLRHVQSDTHINISLGILPFEQELIKRSIAHKLDHGVIIHLPTPEDLIILKSIANRPQDWEDIRMLVKKYPELDKNRLEMWVKAFGEALENPDIWENLEKMIV